MYVCKCFVFLCPFRNLYQQCTGMSNDLKLAVVNHNVFMDYSVHAYQTCHITVVSPASAHGCSSITPCFSLYWALTWCTGCLPSVKNRNAISGCGQRRNHDHDYDLILLAAIQHVRAHCRMTCSTQKLHTLS